MNILFVGPYYQLDGWGYAAREYLRALRLTKHRVTARPIYLNQDSNFYEEDEFTDLEEQYNSYDVVIQNVLPSLFKYFGGMKNVGLSYTESIGLQRTPWTRKFQMMDQVWCTSEFDREYRKCDNKFKVPIPTDISKYSETYPPIDVPSMYDSHFKFYFIGELVERKRVDKLITAFYNEFNINEPVILILKLNSVGGANVNKAASELISGVKQQLRITYNKEILITKYLPQDQLYGLHQYSDCFVTASSGEGFCLPAMDAVGFGNMAIVNDKSSMSEFVKDSDLRLTESVLTPAITNDRPLPYLYNGKDYWYEVNLLDLQDKMRQAYTGTITEHHLSRKGPLEVVEPMTHHTEDQTRLHENLSYEAVAATIERVLDE